MDVPVTHRDLTENHDDRYPHGHQPLHEVGLGVLETTVARSNDVPDHVDLIADRSTLALADLLAESGQDLVPGFAGLEALGVEHPDGEPVVREVLRPESHRHPVAGGCHIVAEDGIDQRGLAHARLAADQDVEAADLLPLLVETPLELLRPAGVECHGRSFVAGSA